MRKFVIMTLLASAALSAQAFAADDQQRRQRGSGSTSEASNDDSQSRPSRPSARSESSDDSQRPTRSESRRAPPVTTADDGAGSQQAQQQSGGRRRGGGAAPQLPSNDATAQSSTQAAPTLSPFQQRLRDRRAARGSDSTQGSATTAQTTARTPGIAGGPRGGFLRGKVATAPAGGRIEVASKPDKGWYDKYRTERLRNLEEHRARNRDHYHLGNYWDPYGYNYRRWQVGWMMWPSYYSHDYWLNDAYSWRLPPVYGPYRWVRYWDDALLVNIYTGQVVDVLYNVFW